MSEYKREIVDSKRNSNSENMFGSQKCGFLFLMLISMVTAMLDLEALQRALNPTYESNAVFKRKSEPFDCISFKKEIKSQIVDLVKEILSRECHVKALGTYIQIVHFKLGKMLENNSRF